MYEARWPTSHHRAESSSDAATTTTSTADVDFILVDDGVATGNTLISCIHLIEKHDPDKIIIALPVAPPSAIKSIKEISDIENVICLHEPRNFSAVGQFYQYFDQVNDQEVIQLLKDANKNLSLDLVC